jgi:hypothetical protein
MEPYAEKDRGFFLASELQAFKARGRSEDNGRSMLL